VGAYSNLLAQAAVSVVVCSAATLVTLLPSEPAISGDALVGLYAAVLGYIFGVIPGAAANADHRKKIELRDGNT
jgi:hypothetical protein